VEELNELYNTLKNMNDDYSIFLTNVTRYMELKNIYLIEVPGYYVELEEEQSKAKRSEELIIRTVYLCIR